VNAPGEAAEPARWLVLGADGYIGRIMVAALTAQGRCVTSAGRTDVDLRDGPGLRTRLKILKPTILLNACGHTPASPVDLMDFYGCTTRLLLEAVAAEVPSCRVILLGSAAEYGETGPAPGASETDALQPVTDYGRAKCRQYEVAAQFSARGLRVTTARLFNAVGPGQGRHHLVGALLDRLSRGERPLRVRHSHCQRDWLDVRDAARALITLAESAAPFSVVNLCSGQGQTVEFVARTVGQLMHAEVTFEPPEPSSNLLVRSVGNPWRIFNLGWRPEYTLTQTLADQCQSIV